MREVCKDSPFRLWTPQQALREGHETLTNSFLVMLFWGHLYHIQVKAVRMSRWLLDTEAGIWEKLWSGGTDLANIVT